jgi:hypothetical protein
MANSDILHAGESSGCGTMHEHSPVRSRCAGWLGAGGRFLGWWAGMSGMMGMFAVCPCCGTNACAGGIVGMGFLGAVAASFMRVRGWFGGRGAARS